MTTRTAWITTGVFLTLLITTGFPAAPDLSGLVHVKPGAKCQTEEGAIATLTLGDRQRVTSIGASGDHKALQQLFDQGIAIELRQLTVFIEDRQGIYAKIRPEGRLELLWVSALRLKCPQEKKGPP
jgi:hypothetical protein